MAQLVFSLELHIPELLILGDRLVETLEGIKAAIRANSATIATEIEQAAVLLQQATTDAEKQEVVEMLHAQGAAIRSIVPDAPPAPGA